MVGENLLVFYILEQIFFWVIVIVLNFLIEERSVKGD